MSLGVVTQLVWNDFFHSFIEFLYAPFIYTEMLWILLPVGLALVLTELYFNRYPRESMGYHKSLENAIFMIFISIDLVRFVFTREVHSSQIIVTVAFTIFSFMICVLDFYHKLPMKLLMRSSSKFILVIISYISIVLVYSDLMLTFNVVRVVSLILSIFLLFSSLVLLKRTFSYLEPKSYEEIEHFLRTIEADIRKVAEETDAAVLEKKEEKPIVKETVPEVKEQPKEKKHRKHRSRKLTLPKLKSI
jgi:Co/Zn/Cd efflux system component